MPSAEALLDIERTRLVAVMEGPDDAQWYAPSLCVAGGCGTSRSTSSCAVKSRNRGSH